MFCFWPFHGKVLETGGKFPLIPLVGLSSNIIHVKPDFVNSLVSDCRNPIAGALPMQWLRDRSIGADSRKIP
jgi:hypothetical protein